MLYLPSSPQGQPRRYFKLSQYHRNPGSLCSRCSRCLRRRRHASGRSSSSEGPYPWTDASAILLDEFKYPRICDLCTLFLHVARVKKPTAMRESSQKTNGQARIACDSRMAVGFFTSTTCKNVDKIWNLWPLPSAHHKKKRSLSIQGLLVACRWKWSRTHCKLPESSSAVEKSSICSRRAKHHVVVRTRGGAPWAIWKLEIQIMQFVYWNTLNDCYDSAEQAKYFSERLAVTDLGHHARYL